jgi:hypothetical protein
VYHDEFRITELHLDDVNGEIGWIQLRHRGNVAINTMRPRLHCGHCRNEVPVRVSY